MKYRYTLEKYRGIKSRYTCPQCGRKYVFTRYIDTETNQYISDIPQNNTFLIILGRVNVRACTTLGNAHTHIRH